MGDRGVSGTPRLRAGRVVQVLATPDGVPASKVWPGQTGVLVFFQHRKGWCVRLDDSPYLCTFERSEITLLPRGGVQPSHERLPENLRRKLRVSESGFHRGTPCWIWIGRLNRNGYGRACHKGREPVAHRAVWEETMGPIAPGLVLDHRCRIRSCCNPAHLQPVTPRMNVHRGEATLFRCSAPAGKAAHA